MRTHSKKLLATQQKLYLLDLSTVFVDLVSFLCTVYSPHIRFYSVFWINGLLHTVTHLIMTYICVRIYSFISSVVHFPELNTILAANISPFAYHFFHYKIHHMDMSIQTILMALIFHISQYSVPTRVPYMLTTF